MTIDWVKWGGIAAIAVGVLLGLTALHHHVYKQGYDAGAAHVQQQFDAARDAAEQKRLADVQAARASGHPTAASAGPGQPGGAPLDVLVNVLSRSDQTSGELAGYADRLRVAGLACERDYDALTVAKH
ncbi:hypothetical protein LMG19089_03678 [Ralstonia edaphis]|uniref:DUF2514 domain-containing protein n=1 Tax=Ralstonia edaphi TaxID=3058599 RepID=A0AB72XC68_9RALS|nr:DUF2514 family protein [Ralstonia sp. LMG 6871]CAJ0704773.1 hypothetical protein LMG19089_03678 [Ralstonia sp. LMG 6871]CAJ0744649.1 hypothetical protein R16034_04675 [Ralstonia sp. LMG 6871]